ncbi:hypothetical protein [Vibrio fortis]|uniref:hypothetical protein n=1 Tax=Vibrio fortis TaxID=212667 RepID=UPI0021C2D5BE|nr:hypothetical protein [Vibrio fortis]
MKLKNTIILSAVSLLFSSNLFASDMYNTSDSTYMLKENVTIKRIQTIHKTGKVYWLKINTKIVDHSGRKTTSKYYYKCWNGNGTPYNNLTQSWITTDKDLNGCPTQLPVK